MIGEPVERKHLRSPWEGIAVLIAVLLPLVVGLLAMASTGRAAEIPSVPAPAKTKPEAATVSGLIVNLNVADAVQLSLVPGITPARAMAILEWRKKHVFQAPVDLLKVKGIGMTTYKKAKPWVVVDGPAVRAVARPAAPDELFADAG